MGIRASQGRSAFIALTLATAAMTPPMVQRVAADGAPQIEDAALMLEVEHVTTRILSLNGDAAYGEYLGAECVTCHQQSGGGNGIPPIRGLPVDYTVPALVEYKLGLRDNNVMRLMTARLGDEEIAALAAYFADDDY